MYLAICSLVWAPGGWSFTLIVHFWLQRDTRIAWNAEGSKTGTVPSAGNAELILPQSLVYVNSQSFNERKKKKHEQELLGLIPQLQEVF